MKAYAHCVVLALILTGVPMARAADVHEGDGPCVEVQIGQDIASHIDCVNQALRRAAEHEHDTPVAQAPITAQSASNKVGTFNDAAARQMMGNAFGVSSQPQRPRNSFTSPLVRATH